MDGQMQALRGLISRVNTLLSAIKEIADPQERFSDAGQHATALGAGWTRSWDDSPGGIRWNNFMQQLDMAIAERRLTDALPLLKQAEKMLLPSLKSGGVAQPPVAAQGETDITNHITLFH